jgi:hypothetical protein
MIGVIENYGTFSMICGRMMLGNNCGIWNVQEHQRASFLVDITNPLRADFRWLHDSLLKKYGLWE